ncbi:hypothetical protein NL676_020935 [Syzygium grande]|nr:hypothetical protein NL676_020935 [Syzygium grande]
MGDLKNLMLLMEAVDGRVQGMSPVHGAVIHQRIEMLKEMSERKKELFKLQDAGNDERRKHSDARRTAFQLLAYDLQDFCPLEIFEGLEEPLPHIGNEKGMVRIGT